MGFRDKLRQSSDEIRTATEVDKKTTPQVAVIEEELTEVMVTSDLITKASIKEALFSFSFMDEDF